MSGRVPVKDDDGKVIGSACYRGPKPPREEDLRAAAEAVQDMRRHLANAAPGSRTQHTPVNNRPLSPDQLEPRPKPIADPWAKTTYSHASDWGAKTETKLSHRSTTSSRTPGRVNQGTVVSEAHTHEPCLLCGGLKPVGCEYHAPRLLIRDGKHIRVDCVGREVPP